MRSTFRPHDGRRRYRWGSTELVSLDGSIASVHPLRLGAVRLTEQFGSCGPGEGKALKELRSFVKDAIRRGQEVRQDARDARHRGTITTLAAMSLRSQPGTETFGLVPNSTRGHEVTLAEVKDFIDQLSNLSVSDRGAIRGSAPTATTSSSPGSPSQRA